MVVAVDVDVVVVVAVDVDVLVVVDVDVVVVVGGSSTVTTPIIMFGCSEQ